MAVTDFSLAHTPGGSEVFGGVMIPDPASSAGDTLQSTGVAGAPAEWAAGDGSTPSLTEVLMVGNDAGNNPITDMAGPTNPGDAANKQYVDDKPTPGIEDVLTASNDANGQTIDNLPNPTSAQQAATRQYVLNVFGGADLETVLGNGNDGGGAQVKNLAEGTDPSDAATVSQIGGSSPLPTLELNPGPEQVYGLLIQAVTGFYDVYNAFIRVLDENDVQVFNIDAGGFDMTAPGGQESVHVLFNETDTSRTGEYSSRKLRISAADGGPFVNLSAESGLQLSAVAPSDNPNAGQVQVYYDDTPGSAKVKFRAKDNNGDPVVAEIALT